MDPAKFINVLRRGKKKAAPKGGGKFLGGGCLKAGSFCVSFAFSASAKRWFAIAKYAIALFLTNFIELTTLHRSAVVNTLLKSGG
jgi:hypothetical protein